MYATFKEKWESLKRTNLFEAKIIIKKPKDKSGG
jgi:hypothetical protein